MGRITVKDYTAKSGERVMAGQAEPKGDYGCQQLSQEEHKWGFKEKSLNTAGAIEQLTQTAVDTAPSKGANYAYVRLPSEVTVGVVDVNYFKNPQVVYYKCANLPPKA